jgi:hypothetical protein
MIGDRRGATRDGDLCHLAPAMAIVPCPACGASVLSVASRCPTCKRYIDLPRAPQARAVGPEWARAKAAAPVVGGALLVLGLLFGERGAPTPPPGPPQAAATGIAQSTPLPVAPAPVTDRVAEATPLAQPAAIPARTPPARASASPLPTPLPRSAPAADAPAPRVASRGAPLQTVEWVNLRRDPSRGAAVVLVIPPDAAVLADSATVGWRRVRYGDAVGWVDYRLLASGGD